MSIRLWIFLLMWLISAEASKNVVLIVADDLDLVLDGMVIIIF